MEWNSTYTIYDFETDLELDFDINTVCKAIDLYRENRMRMEQIRIFMASNRQKFSAVNYNFIKEYFENEWI